MRAYAQVPETEIDWGLVRVDIGADDAVVTERALDGSDRTAVGQVAGTPAFMPPEQARGEQDRLDARSDRQVDTQNPRFVRRCRPMRQRGQDRAIAVDRQ